MSPLRLVILTFSLINVVALHADEPADELPKPGAWARYHVVIKRDNGTESTGKLTLKFLEQEQDNGRPCRWLEFEWKYDDTADWQIRCLIPEKALCDSDRPLNEAVKALEQVGDDRPREMQPGELKLSAFVLYWLPAARKAAERIDEPQTVEYQAGKLTVPQAYRIQETKSSDVEGNRSREEREFKVWVHPNVPMGHVRLSNRGRIQGDLLNLTWTHDQHLEDFGFDAKSAFPN